MFKRRFYGAFLLLGCLSTSCGIYSFTGSSLHPDVKTIEVKNLYNNSGGGPPYLDQSLTQNIKDYFQQNSKLILVNSNGDIQLEGNITSYSTSPEASTNSSNGGAPTANSIRLTLIVKIKMTNKKDETANFDKDFTAFKFFSSDKSLQDVERELIREMNKKIAQDIFTETVANW